MRTTALHPPRPAPRRAGMGPSNTRLPDAAAATRVHDLGWAPRCVVLPFRQDRMPPMPMPTRKPMPDAAPGTADGDAARNARERQCGAGLAAAASGEVRAFEAFHDRPTRSRALARRIGTRRLTVPPADDGFQPFIDGARIKVLHEAGGRMSYLLHFAWGAVLPAHRHLVNEACIVLEGELQIGAHRAVPAGGFHLAPAGSLHAPVASRGSAQIFLHGAVPEVADLI